MFGLIPRWVLLCAGLFLLMDLAVTEFTSSSFIALDDYVEYWSAGKLNLVGDNPYDPEQLAPIQVEAGRLTNVPIMMWNPPWTLALAMPLSWLPYPVSRLLWFLLNMGIVFLSATWSWRVYGGDPDRRWLSWIAAFSFAPALHVLKAGQIAPVLLLGVVGFLHFVRHEQWRIAGASAALITVKPHLLYLFGLVLVVWSLHRRKWGVLLGFTGALVMAMVASMVVNPELPGYYLYAVRNYPPAQWATPTIGGLLRVVFGARFFWLQFLPPVAGGMWCLCYWWQRRDHWNWAEQMPMLVLVSVMTAAYGWTFDHTVSLLAIVQMAIWMTGTRARKGWRLALLTVYVGFSLVGLFTSMEQLAYWWMAGWLLIWYLVGRRVLVPQEKLVGGSDVPLPLQISS